MERNKIYNEDCIKGMKMLPYGSVDITVTSPPYDELRVYGEGVDWNFDIFKEVANELFRVTAPGGVVVWVVADGTVDGSETGTSFRQALYFKEIGFRIHDTMLYHKQTYIPLTQNRYEQVFEYMFVFSKGRPKTFNPIMLPCKTAGETSVGKPSYRRSATRSGEKIKKDKLNYTKDTKQHGNIFTYLPAGGGENCTSSDGVKHYAAFAEELVYDQLFSWSNVGDLVLDPFAGSGTTAKVAKEMGRDFIAFEMVDKFHKLACERVFGNEPVKRRGLF